MIKCELNVGVIQTSLQAEAAWHDDGSGNWRKCVRMSRFEELRAKREIRHYLASLLRRRPAPDIVLLPELAVPLGFQRQLERAAEKLEAIVIAGLDYQIKPNAPAPTVSNEAVIVVPKYLNGKLFSRKTQTRVVGKTHPAPSEKRKLDSITGAAVSFLPHPVVWLFRSADFGDFGVAICYDFMDLDRIVMYRNKIQTLFILAYNRDTTSFDHLAEALSRMLFCNVVICNCGFFGGSVAVSPFRKAFRRLKYKHSGQQLPNAQVVRLPLRSLKQHQSGKPQNDLKSLPPGFGDTASLDLKTSDL